MCLFTSNCRRKTRVITNSLINDVKIVKYIYVTQPNQAEDVPNHEIYFAEDV